MPDNDESVQIFRIEIRFDFAGTPAQAKLAARDAADKVDGEITAIFDGNFDEMDELWVNEYVDWSKGGA